MPQTPSQYNDPERTGGGIKFISCEIEILPFGLESKFLSPGCGIILY